MLLGLATQNETRELCGVEGVALSGKVSTDAASLIEFNYS